MIVSSIYIHIPFCEHICSYCDFSKIYYYPELVSKYLKALEWEIKEIPKTQSYHTIYIGGGTPSSLTPQELEILFEMLDKIPLDSTYEYTIECNIENITEEKLKIMKKHRVNRISIGVESFHNKNLQFLDRHYLENQIKPTITLIKKYFSNINVDLIYALPGETLTELEEDIKQVLALDVPHISTYSLMIEPHTKLFFQNQKPISEELDRKMYDVICKNLKSQGYLHYEISNFAKPGYESKHNLTYWKNENYYGIGLGASGYIQNIRYTNTKSMNQYLKGKTHQEIEIQNEKLKIENEIMLRFRTNIGINKKDFFKKYNFDIKDKYQIVDLLEAKILIETKDHYYISEDYWYLLNEILLRFIEE